MSRCVSNRLWKHHFVAIIHTEVVEVRKTVLVKVPVAVVDGVGIERHEQADDKTVAANRDSGAGILRGSKIRLATFWVGSVSSTVVTVTMVLVTLLFEGLA